LWRCDAQAVGLDFGFVVWNTEGWRWEKDVDNIGAQAGVVLDAMSYDRHDVRYLPVGYARAPFTMYDFGVMEHFPAYVATGPSAT
jgi:hypothetical protein